MKERYLSPEWKLIVLMSEDILSKSDEFDQDDDEHDQDYGDSWTKDY